MRVLQLLKTSVGATWALRQVRELVLLGVEVHVALPAGPMVTSYEAVGAHVHIGQYSLPMSAPQSWPALFGKFRDLVKEVNPDLIHSHFVGCTLTMRMALGKNHLLPRVFQVPGPLHLEHSLYRKAEIGSAGDHDFWIGSCEWTCDRYERSGIDRSRVFLAYYGSDLETFVKHPSGKLRSELSIPPGRKVVGMVAYMYAPKRYLGQRRGLKGHEDLVDAIAIARQHGLDVTGVFVGGAWNGATTYETKVQNYARSKLGEHAHFLGTRTDVPELYPDFDVVAHPSHSENVGGAAESLILGVPTIASNTGGFPDLVKPMKTGWLVPPKQPQALAEALVEVLKSADRAREYAANGEALARKLMDVKTNARDVHSAYESILTSGRGHR